MTVSSAINRVQYTGNGNTDEYAFTFKIFDEAELLVTVLDTDDVEETLVLNTDYTVDDVGESAGGTITLVDGNLTSGYIITIRRRRELTQTADFRNLGDFHAGTHEDTMDKLVMNDQQQQDEINRSLKLPESVDVADFSPELPVPSASKFLKSNAGNSGFEFAEFTSSGSVVVPGSTGYAYYAGSSTFESRTFQSGPGIYLENASGASNTVIGAHDQARINSITNPSPESGTTGWATYADAAGTSPVDGTGGSPTVTWTRSTSSPLIGSANFLLTKDAANRQGEGVGYAFTLDSAFTSKVNTIRFRFEGSANFAAADLVCHIYSVGGAALITPTITAMHGTSGEFTANWTATSSTTYRLILHIATTNALAWTLKVDNVYVGPAETVRVPIVAAAATGTVGYFDQVITLSHSADYTYNLPAVAGYVGKRVQLIKITDHTYETTIDANSTEVINDVETLKLRMQYESVTLLGTSTGWLIVDRYIPSLWVPYTPTCSWTANTTPTGFFRRVGDSMELQLEALCTGAPTSATLTFDLPFGAIKTTKLIGADGNFPLGPHGFAIDTGSNGYLAGAHYSDTNTIVARYYDDGSGGVLITGSINATSPFTFGNTDLVQIKAVVPIDGWTY